MTQNEIGSFIGALRKAGGMTQRELAERIGVSDKSVSRWERGDGLPDLTLIPVIAEVFDVTCDELLTGKRQSDQTSKPRNTEQQVRRLSTTAVETLKVDAVFAILIGVLAPIFTTVLYGVWKQFTSCTLVGVALLLVAAVVMWFGLTKYRGRLEGDVLTAELRSEAWGKVFPYLSVFVGIMTFSTLYILGMGFVYSMSMRGYWDALRAFSAGFMLIATILMTVLLFFGWGRPLLVKWCASMGLKSEHVATKKWERRMSRVLAVLLVATGVLRFAVDTAPYSIFVKGTKCEDLATLQQHLDEKKPMFLTEAQEKNHISANTHSITDANGKTYQYQNYGLRDEIVFTSGTVFPATIYTGGEQDLAREIQNYIYEGIFYLYPLELVLCGGIYLLLKKKA